ncbi:MAG: hypothetical protein ACRCTO_09405 [Pseudomonas paracarnis]
MKRWLSWMLAIKRWLSRMLAVWSVWRGRAERISVPGQWVVWREGDAVRVRVMTRLNSN